MPTLELCREMCLENSIEAVKIAKIVNYENQVSSLFVVEFTCCVIKPSEEILRRDFSCPNYYELLIRFGNSPLNNNNLKCESMNEGRWTITDKEGRVRTRNEID